MIIYSKEFFCNIITILPFKNKQNNFAHIKILLITNENKTACQRTNLQTEKQKNKIHALDELLSNERYVIEMLF